MGNYRVIPLIKEEGLDTRLCGYLPGAHRASVIYTNNDLSTDKKLRQDFQRAAVESGFELMGGPHRVTINNCPKCQACVQVRVNVREFEFNREQRRVLRLHGDLTVTREATDPDDEQYELYTEYLKGRFARRGNDLMIKRNFDLCAKQWLRSQTLHMPEKIEEHCSELVGAMYYEDCGNAIILGNQYYNRDIKKRGFGTFGILSLIKMAKERGDVDYIYLGPWVKDSKTLDYKKHFYPLEGFNGTEWVKFDPALEHRTTPPELGLVYRLNTPAR